MKILVYASQPGFSKGEKIEITDEERTMALSASKLLGGGIHGVDIMRDSKDGDKPYMIEVNGCPGLSGIEAITGENVAGAIIQYVLDNYKRNGLRKTTDSNGATATAKPLTEAKPATETFAKAFDRLNSEYINR